MAITVQESGLTRGASQDGGTFRGVLRFDVYGDEVTSGAIALNADGVPGYGDTHANMPGLICVNKSASLEGPASSVWRVECEFRNVTIDPDEPQPGDVGFVEISTTFTTRIQKRWRGKNVIIPTFGDAATTYTVGNNIGGEKIDMYGEPQEKRVFFAELQVSLYVDGFPAYASYRAGIGKRNETTIFGASKGYVLGMPTTITRTDLNRYRVIFRFAYDSEFFLEQLPERKRNGEILPTTDPPTTTTDGHAKYVYWYQPYPEYYDFHQMSGVFTSL